MRLLVARCEVLYTGRLTARLPEAVRLLMFKAMGPSWFTTMLEVFVRSTGLGRFSDRSSPPSASKLSV